MNSFRALLRLHIKMTLGLTVLSALWKSDRKEFLKKAGIVGLVIIALVYGLFSLCMLFLLIMQGAVPLGLGGAVLSVIFTLVILGLTLFGVFSMSGSIIFSSDVQYYASLPIPEKTVFGSRIFISYLGKLLTAALICIPPVIIYGVIAGAGLGFYLASAFILLFVPLIPLTISILLTMALGRFTLIRKHADMIRTVMTLILIVGLVLIQNYLVGTGVSAAGDASKMTSIAEAVDSLTSSALFIPGKLIAESVIKLDFLSIVNLFAYALASLLAIMCIYVPGSRRYYKVVLSTIETRKHGARRVTVKGARPAFWAFFWRELHLQFRTPAYVLNYMSAILIMPICILTVNFAFSHRQGGNELNALITSFSNMPVFILIFAGILAAMSAMTNSAVTCISREGKCFRLCKTLPVPFSRQLTPKLLFSFCVNVAGILSLSVCVVIFMHLPVTSAAISVALAIAANVTATCAGAIPDILRPKLIWNSENEAVKQNFNTLTGMLTGILSVVVLGGLSWLLLSFLPGTAAILATFGVLIIAGVIAVRLTCAFADRKLTLYEK